MRAFAYIRVSKEREGMISPEIQRDSITRYCESRGWTVLETFTDIDLSGKLPPEKRPGLQELLSRAQSGECDTVVVYRVDRLSREPADYYAIMAVLREAGVAIDAAAQPKEASPEGELLWDLSAILARYESLKLGARLKDMHRRLAAQGRWGGGIVPYGWRRVRGENGTQLVLDPEEARWRRWMHEQYWRGWSCLRIAKYLNEHGVSTRRDSTWNDGTVWNMLRSPYQAGAREVEGGLQMGGNVEPLLEREQYEHTLGLMTSRHRRRGRVGRHAIPARLVRCGTCGGALVAGSHEGPQGLLGVYECQNRKQGTCKRGVSIRYSLLEAYVERRFFQHVKGSRGERQSQDTPALTPIIEELERTRESLGRLALMRAEGRIGEDEFQSARALQRKRQAKLEAELTRASERLESDVKEALLDEAWEDLAALTEESWHKLSIEARREILDLVIERIVVAPTAGHDASHTPAHKRVRIRWR